MTRTEALNLNRELYRYEGGAVTRRLDDNRFWCTVSIRYDQIAAGTVGHGVAQNHLVAQALAWRNLKRKAFVL